MELHVSRLRRGCFWWCFWLLSLAYRFDTLAYGRGSSYWPLDLCRSSNVSSGRPTDIVDENNKTFPSVYLFICSSTMSRAYTHQAFMQAYPYASHSLRIQFRVLVSVRLVAMTCIWFCRFVLFFFPLTRLRSVDAFIVSISIVLSFYPGFFEIRFVDSFRTIRPDMHHSHGARRVLVYSLYVNCNCCGPACETISFHFHIFPYNSLVKNIPNDYSMESTTPHTP